MEDSDSVEKIHLTEMGMRENMNWIELGLVAEMGGDVGQVWQSHMKGG